jgi:hypothetical protein
MPESIVREELEALSIRVQGFMQLPSRRRDQDTLKDQPPTSHFVVSVARGPEVQKVWSLSELCSCQYLCDWYLQAPLFVWRGSEAGVIEGPPVPGASHSGPA